MPSTCLAHLASGPMLYIEPCFHDKSNADFETKADRRKKKEESAAREATIMFELLQLVKNQSKPTITIRFGRFEVEGVLKFRGFHEEQIEDLSCTDKLLCALSDPTIESLDLYRANNGDAMAKLISTLTSITSLSLSSIGGKGVKALSCNTNITSLRLQCRDRSGDEVAKELAHKSTITTLDLSSSRVGAEGAKALSLNTTITSLGLQYNEVGDEGATALSHNTTITTLDLSSNAIRTEGAKALSCNTTIRSLDLRLNYARDEGATALSHNTTITKLSLESNKIYDEGAKALSQNTTITSLNLTYNSTGYFIIKSFITNTTLTELSVNSVPPEVTNVINNNKMVMMARRRVFVTFVWMMLKGIAES